MSIKIDKISVRYEQDTVESIPDHLGKFSSEPGPFAVDRKKEMGRNEFRYFNAENVENMKEARENYARAMEFEKGNVSMMGIHAEARVITGGPSEWLINTIHSGGLYGIDSDSSAEYLADIAREQIAYLRDTLHEFGIIDETIDSAPIESVEIKL